MKTTPFLRAALFTALFSLASCTKEEENNNNNFTTADASANAQMDAIAGDVTLIADDRLTQQITTRAVVPPSILPSCATVTTTVTGGQWTSIVDFGTAGCQFTNGHGANLRGQVIVKGSTDFSQSPYVWTYDFNNFYYDDILVSGTKTLSRTMETTTQNPNIHPVIVTDLDLHLTYPNGNTYHRTGSRTWDHIVGYDTPLVWEDNVFLATGSWVTTGVNYSDTSTITTPLRFEIACLYRLVSGVIHVERNGHYADLNYGVGTCDNNATIAIDGGTTYPFSW